MKLKVLGPRALLKVVEKEEKTKGGLYVPESARESNKEGIVEEVGKYDDDKKAFPVKKGDKVIYSGYSSSEITINEEKYIIIDVKDILAIIE
jgi:chaperonin GroES